jgi:hypothetical protein
MNDKHDWKFDWLRSVLRGTWVDPQHFTYVKGILLRAFDEQDMQDKLAKLKQTEPDIFSTPPNRAEHQHTEDVIAVMRASGVTSAAYPVLKSILRHGTNAASMTRTVAKLKTSTPEWFKRR